MPIINEVSAPAQRSHICETVLRALPQWFGIESSILEYIEAVRTMSFWAAFEAGIPIGFIALKVHNTYTSEISVMGVLPEYHRQGIGTKLLHCCERSCTNIGTEFLTVKTLDGSAIDENYAQTRQFYVASGFRPLEVFPLLWDERNPCLFMAKHLSLPAI